MSQAIGLLGSGGQADEITSYLSSQQSVAFRAVSSQYLDAADDRLIDIENPGEQSQLPVLAAVGAPALRQDMVQSWPGTSYAQLISEQAYVDKDLTIGQGSVIAPQAAVTTNVRIGQHVLVNIGVTISHDCTIGNYVTISPGAHIAGKVTLGDGVFVGIGASISNGVTIAAGCVIGAGAVVLADVEQANSVVVGMPAKVIKQNDGWLREI